MKLRAELKRRNVLRMAGLYLVGAWLVVQVASQLKLALNAGQQHRLIDVGTSDPDAYATYLRATDVFNRRDATGYEEAIAALEQALQRDPQFARAHAEQALRLNPTLAEPHAVLGVVHQGARRYGEAHAAFERALQLDAADDAANLWSALLHCNTGHITRCESGLERTLEIDPLLPNALNWRGRLRKSLTKIASPPTGFPYRSGDQ